MTYSVKPLLPTFVGRNIGALKPVLQPDGEPQQPAPGITPPAAPPTPTIPGPPEGPGPGGLPLPPAAPTTPTNPGPTAPPGSGPTTTTPAAPAGPPVDWAQIYWGALGLPPELLAAINKIFAQYPDATTGFQVAQNYLRGTDWYAKTFPGIAYGIRNGLFTDENGYRQYVNELNNLYQQYNNRAVTGDEAASWLTQGRNSAYVGNVFQGNAIAQTQGPEAQYEAGAFSAEGQLTPDQLQAYGQEQAGIDTPLGQQITQRLQQAKTKMDRIFQGTLGRPDFTTGQQGLNAPSLRGSNGPPDLPA